MRTIDSIIEMAEFLSEIHPSGQYRGGDPYIAFSDNNVRVFERAFEDKLDGMLVYDNGRFNTFINTNVSLGHTPERQRFTASHEFGHFSIEHHNDGVRSGRMLHGSLTGFVSHQGYEIEADTFAAHFLMPTEPFLECCKTAQTHWGAQQILDVSNTFGSSLASSARRCVQGLPGDSLLFVWNGDAVHWPIGGGNWTIHENKRRVNHRSHLVRGSATEQALADPNSCKPFAQSISTLSCWSRGINPAYGDDPIITEYAIPRGRFGVMTLLRPVN